MSIHQIWQPNDDNAEHAAVCSIVDAAHSNEVRFDALPDACMVFAHAEGHPFAAKLAPEDAKALGEFLARYYASAGAPIMDDDDA